MRQRNLYYMAGGFLGLLTISFGGYFEFVNTILAGVLIILVLIATLVQKNKIQDITDSFWFGVILFVGYGLSIFYAVDSGIAVEGLGKKFLLVAWGCLLCLLTQKEKKDLLSWIPWIGFSMVIFSCIGYFVPGLREYVFQANRLGGWFQYANTCGGFLLVGSVILLLKDVRRKMDYIMLAVLLLGVFLTGSRSTMLLLLFAIIYLIIRKKELRKYLIVGSTVAIAAVVIVAFLIGNTENIARITTLFTQSSTVYGRALYNYDGICQLGKHPFGLGYLGFYFIQNGVQTGLYSIRYVHNDWLQIGLDIGIVPMLLILFLVVKNIWQKKKNVRDMLVLLLLFLQGFMEFNMEYSIMGCLMMLCLDGTTISKVNERMIKKVTVGLCAMALPFLLYLSIPLTLGYLDKSEAAVAYYPWEINEQLKLLSQCEDEMEAAELAEKILKQNKTCSLAYDAMAIVAINNGKYPEAVSYMKKSIENNRFEPEGYAQLEWLLTEIIKQEVVEDPAYYIQEYENLQKLKTENQNKVSFFGRRIVDKVELVP